jgi:hypothetical protein
MLSALPLVQTVKKCVSLVIAKTNTRPSGLVPRLGFGRRRAFNRLWQRQGSIQL